MKNFLVAGALLLLLSVLALLGSYLWWGHRADSALQDELQRIRTSGAPVDWSDLARTPIPENENAAPLLTAAFSWLERNEPPGIVDLDLGLEGVEADQWNGVAEQLEALAPFFAQLEIALARPDCDFGLEDDPLLSNSVVQFGTARAALMRVLAQAVLLARSGDVEAATAALSRGQRLGEYCRGHSLVGMLVRLAMERKVFDTMRMIATLPDADVLAARAAFEPLLAAVDLRGTSVEALQQERAFGWHIYQEMLGGDSPYSALEDTPLMGSMVMRPFLRANAAKHLELIGEGIEIARRPYHQARASLERIDQSAQEMSALYSMVGMLLPAVMSAPQKEAEARSSQQTTRIGLAALVYRARHGEWPGDMTALEEVFGEGRLPLDPLTGKEFLLVQIPGALRIESGFQRDASNPQLVWPVPENYRWDLED